MIILGIDPGSHRIGYGLIKKDRQPSLIDCGIIEIKSSAPTSQIGNIAQQLRQLIQKFSPNLAAIEKIYFSKNRKTAINVAQTRGALISELQKAGVVIQEYDPTTIKKTVTGYGLADKKAVQKMVCLSLGLKQFPHLDDAADALAAALTALYHQ